MFFKHRVDLLKGNFHSWLLLVLTLILCLNVFDTRLDIITDNAIYYLLGTSLMEGEGYSQNWRVGEPPATKYPPGYPAIVAFLRIFFGAEIFGVKLFNVLLFMVSVTIYYRIFLIIGGSMKISFFSASALMLNSTLLKYSSVMMSEISFLLFTGLALLFTVKSTERNKPWRDVSTYLLILCLAAAWYVRTLALCLWVGVAIHFLVGREFRRLMFVFTGSVLLGLPWVIWVNLKGGSPYLRKVIYMDPGNPELGLRTLSEWISWLTQNFVDIFNLLMPHAFWGIDLIHVLKYPVLGAFVSTATLLFFIHGVRNMKKYRVLLLSYPAVTMLILLLFSSPEALGTRRYLAVLSPVMVFPALSGLSEVLRKVFVNRKKGEYLTYILSGLILLSFVPGVINLYHDVDKPLHPGWRNYFDVAIWVSQNTEEEAVIVCRKMALFSLVSGRMTTTFAWTTDADSLINKMYNDGADYVVVENLGFNSTEQYLKPALRSYLDSFEIVLHLKDPDTFLLAFKRDES